ncbi:MFS transporter [Nocardioides sp. NPDC006273]|uniref:MFS transporter n=1 Tax=Nocardioides sp. NPDC006273 TaxID=3155598 RepID=UPI0033B772CE
MTTTTQPRSMSRIAMASLVGTTIEFYDFLIYGYAAALVFGPLFFPSLGTAAGTWASVATFGVAFVFRPLGAVVFGHFGDRLGRKRTLVTTLLMMGGATFAIGLIPTAAAIGAAAPLLLVLLRATQGTALGGEWAGAALLTSEYAAEGKRGRYSLFPQLGPGLGVIIASGTFLLTIQVIGLAAFQQWAWRVPFLVSIVLIALGLWVRLNIAETPSFAKVTAARAKVSFPFAAALHDQWRQILLGGGMLAMTFGAFYLAVVFLGGIATRPPEENGLGLTLNQMLTANMVAGLVLCVAVIGSALLSDRVGRRAVLLSGTVFGLIAGPVAFAILTPGDAGSFTLAMAVLMIAIGIPYGPAAAYLPELFRAEYRYTAAGMAYNLAGIIGGALPLVIGGALLERWGTSGLAGFVTVLAVFSTACLLALRETRGQVLDADPVSPATTA